MGDSGYPNYLRVGPDGVVTADFAGHVSAAGVDLIAGTALAPPADRRITWHHTTPTGALVADIYSFEDAIGSHLIVETPNHVAEVLGDTGIAAGKPVMGRSDFFRIGQIDIPGGSPASEMMGILGRFTRDLPAGRSTQVYQPVPTSGALNFQWVSAQAHNTAPGTVNIEHTIPHPQQPAAFLFEVDCSVLMAGATVFYFGVALWTL